MGRIAANADKPKGYEPKADYRFSCNAAELSCRLAGLHRGPRGREVAACARPPAGRCPRRRHALDTFARLVGKAQGERADDLPAT